MSKETTTTQRQQPKATIKPTKTSKQPNMYESALGLMIRAPYDEWDINNMLIDSPKLGESSSDKTIKFQTCNFQYNYFREGKKTKDKLIIEFPRDDKYLCTSDYGIKEVLNTLTKEELFLKDSGKEVKRTGTGRYQIFCKLGVHDPDSIKLKDILNEIYAKCVKYMAEYGQGENCKCLLEKEYQLPKKRDEPIGPNNAALNFRHPVWYMDKSADTGLHKVKDLEVPASITLAVKVGDGKYATKFCDDNLSKLNPEDLKTRGFRHIPLMEISSLFVGAVAKIRMSMTESIIIEYLAPSVISQGQTINERKEMGLLTADALRQKAQEMFESDNNKDPLSLEQGTPSSQATLPFVQGTPSEKLPLLLEPSAEQDRPPSPTQKFIGIDYVKPESEGSSDDEGDQSDHKTSSELLEEHIDESAQSKIKKSNKNTQKPDSDDIPPTPTRKPGSKRQHNKTQK